MVVNFPLSLGTGGNCKIWNMSFMEKLEMQLDKDLEESKAPQAINLFWGGRGIVLKLGKYVILLLNPTFVFV